MKNILAFAKGFISGLFRKKTITVIPPTPIGHWHNVKKTIDADGNPILTATATFNKTEAAQAIADALNGHGIQATILTPDQFCQIYDCVDKFELATKRMVAELVCEDYEPNSCDQHQRPVVVDGVQAGLLHYARVGSDFFFFKERFSGDSDDVLANHDGFVEWQGKVDSIHDEFWDRIHGEGENE